MKLAGQLVSWSLILHGTKDNPIRLKQPDQGIIVTPLELTEVPVFTGTTPTPVSSGTVLCHCKYSQKMLLSLV